MNFELNEDQVSVQELCRNFARRHVAPNIRENDRAHHFDKSVIRKMSEADILGLCFPEEYGVYQLPYEHCS